MKKWFVFTCTLALFIFIGGCGISGKNNEDLLDELDKYDVVHSKAEKQDDDFIYRLVSEQEEYTDSQSVTLYAELEYTGEQSEVTIEHAASPFYFPMEENIRGFEISYPMPEPLVTTTLKKGEPLRVHYTGSGAYSEDEETAYVEFMKDFIENGFPTGYYTVNGFADFWVQKNDQNNEPDRYHIEAQVDFKVK